MFHLLIMITLLMRSRCLALRPQASALLHRRLHCNTPSSMKRYSNSNCNNDANKVPTKVDLLNNAALVGGTTVGAGILALPTYAATSGFVPSSLGLVASWLFMVVTGLLIAEVSTALQKQKGDETEEGAPPVGMLYLMQNTLGDAFAPVTGGLYVFNHYALLIAYISEAGEILSDAFHLPVENLGMVLFTATIGGLVAFNDEKTVSAINNLFCVMVLLSFALLLSYGVPQMSLGGLAYQDASKLAASIPIFFLALVFHNVVPVVASRLRYDRSAIVRAIVVGTAVPLLMFILWDALVLGVAGSSAEMLRLSTQNVESQLVDMFSNTKPVIVDGMLSVLTGGDKLLPVAMQSTVLSTSAALDRLLRADAAIEVFSEFAIVTSFIGFVYGLLSFYEDAFPRLTNKTALYALVLVPPLLVACYDANVFLRALDVAGTFGISLLFGAVPALMAWRVRRAAQQQTGDYTVFVPGGDAALLAVLGCTAFVVVEKLAAGF